jgi:hypothetical protein
MNAFDCLAGVDSITINYADVRALQERSTNNPLAEADLPVMLRDACSRGITVYVTERGKPGVFRVEKKGNGIVVVREGAGTSLSSS